MKSICRLLLPTATAIFINGGQARCLDLLPPLVGPNIQFHTGGVVGDKPEMFEAKPVDGGSVSPWKLTQWGKAEILRPENYKRAGQTFVWASQDGNSRLTATRAGNQWAYRIYGQEGDLTSKGGANLFLSTDLLRSVPLDKPIDLTLDAAISKSHVHFDDPAAKNGAVLAQVFAGLWLYYKDPTSGIVTPVDLQVDISNSRNERASYRACNIQKSGKRQIITTRSLPASDHIAFGSKDQGEHHLRYRISDFVCDLIAHDIPCKGGGPVSNTWDESAGDLRNWSVRKFFIGIETQNRDTRKQAASSPSGDVEVELTLSDIALERADEGSTLLCRGR